MDQLLDHRMVSGLRAWLVVGDPRRTVRATVAVIAIIAVAVGALLAFLRPIGGIAVLIAGMGALLLLRDLRWGLLALLGVVVVMPFASLPFKLGFTPTFLDLVLGALYVVWGTRLVTRRQDDLILTPLGLPVFTFVALAVFSFLMGLAHSRPTSNDLRTFAEVMMGFGLFFLAVNNVRDESLLRLVTATLILAGTMEAAIGISLYVVPERWAVRLLSPLGRLGYPVGFGALRYINDDPNLPMRAIGTNVDPNILGAMLVIVMILTGVQLFAQRPVLPRLWTGLCLAVMGLCLFLTYSRSSMLGVVATLAMVAVLRYRKLLILLVMVGLVFALLPQTQSYILHFIQGIEIADRSTQMRMGEYRDAFALIQRYPWFGVGFVGTPDIDLYLGVASIYLTLAAQMGIVGLVAFLLTMAAFLAYLIHVWLKLPQDSTLEPFLLGYGAAVLGSLVSGVLDHTLLTYPHAVALFWLSLGLGTATTRMAAANIHGNFT